MALYDISRLSGPSALRPVGQGLTPGAKPEPGPARSPAPASPAANGISVETGSRITAGPVPVEQDRVQEIRAALRDGSYPLVPTQISDAIIAARLMLSHSQ